MVRASQFFASEPGMRLAAFFGVLVIMASWELLAPRRKWTVHRPARWASNLALVAVSTIVVRLVVPLTAVGAALVAQQRGWGLLHQLAWPDWIEIVLAAVALDCAIYFQHVMFHAVPAFWRLHMIHHADLDLDVTTGLRFHTLEIIVSMLIKIAVVFLLGAPALAVLIFEVLLNATSMFNHSNVRIPLVVDRVLRWLVVTPDMHRVHHSCHANETNSNFGFNHPWWDRIFGTYRDQPAEGHTEMTLGIMQFRDERQTSRLLWILTAPFYARTGSYPLRARSTEPVQTPPEDPAKP